MKACEDSGGVLHEINGDGDGRLPVSLAAVQRLPEAEEKVARWKYNLGVLGKMQFLACFFLLGDF